MTRFTHNGRTFAHRTPDGFVYLWLCAERHVPAARKLLRDLGHEAFAGYTRIMSTLASEGAEEDYEEVDDDGR